MNKLRISIPFLLSTLFSSLCFPQIPMNDVPINTGNNLYAVCRSDNTSMSLLCMGYIDGVISGFYASSGYATFVYDGVEVDTLRGFCLPDGAEMEQQRDVVVNYLRRNPENRQSPAELLIHTAFMEAWPCN